MLLQTGKSFVNFFEVNPLSSLCNKIAVGKGCQAFPVSLTTDNGSGMEQIRKQTERRSVAP